MTRTGLSTRRSPSKPLGRCVERMEMLGLLIVRPATDPGAKPSTRRGCPPSPNPASAAPASSVRGDRQARPAYGRGVTSGRLQWCSLLRSDRTGGMRRAIPPFRTIEEFSRPSGEVGKTSPAEPPPRLRRPSKISSNELSPVPTIVPERGNVFRICRPLLSSDLAISSTCRCPSTVTRRSTFAIELIPC